MRTFAGLLTLVLLTVVPAAGAASPRPAGSVPPGHLVPVAVGATSPVSTEDYYNAFPASVRLPSGPVLTAYKSGPTHGGPTSNLVLRRSVDGRVWSAPQTVPLPGGYAWGPGAIAVETAAQGARIYLAVARIHYPAGGVNNPDEQRYWLYTSDDDGKTWTQRAQFPTSPGAWGFGPSALLVLNDGTLLAGGYSSDGAVRFLASSDRGGTFTPAGTITIAGRTSGSPQLGQLPGGQVFTVFRTDAAGTLSRFHTAMRTGAASWGAPLQLLGDATSLNGVTVLSGDTITVMYRGWADRSDDGPSFRPIRVLCAELTPAGAITAWRTNIDLNPALLRRSLGGDIVDAPGGAYLAVWGVEGPLTTATAAAVVAVPLEFRPET